MLNLFSYTVYQDPGVFGTDISGFLRGHHCDGLELLTSFEIPQTVFHPSTVTVHLPYAIDWLSAWDGRQYDVDDDSIRLISFGRNRANMVDNVRKAIASASVLNPAHGVMHACNADISEMYKHEYTRSDSQVVRAFCDFMNETVSIFPKGEPPFRLVFENLWWPGLRMIDDSGYRILEKSLEFDNWGLCVDTGHMMSCIPHIYSEEDGIDALLEIFDRYPSDMKDRISAMHFHYSASGRYRESFEELGFDTETDIMNRINNAFTHVGKIDQHLPFSSERCNELIDALYPEYLIHELPGHGNSLMADYDQQRALIR